MSRIVLYTSGTLGDLFPFLALGLALAARGHDVRMAVNPGMLATVRAAGLEATAVDEPCLDAEVARRHAADWDHWAGHAEPDPDLYADMARPLMRSLSAVSADAELLIATSIRPWAWVVHHLTGVPWISLSVTPAEFFEPQGAHERRLFAERLRNDQTSMRSLLDHACAGTEMRLPPGLPGLAPQVLLASDAHFHHPRVDHPALAGRRLHMTGFMFHDGPGAAAWQPSAALEHFMQREPRPMVLSFSSLPLADRQAVLAAHVEAAARLGHPLLIQRGWAGFCVEDLPPAWQNRDDIHFCDFVPHDWLFARAACVIQHGGIGSVARALRRGCPQLIEPYGNDQFFNALRVVALGAGAAMNPGKLTVGGLVRVLRDKVLTAACRRRGTELAAHIIHDAGTAQACMHAESLLRAPGLPRATRTQSPNSSNGAGWRIAATRWSSLTRQESK